MVDQLVTFSDVIEKQIEADLDALESNMVPGQGGHGAVAGRDRTYAGAGSVG